MKQTVNMWDMVAGEPVNVPGHWADRQADTTVVEARRSALNGELSDEALPLLLDSDMSPDPCEGVQGSYKAVVEADCQKCPSEHGILSHHTLADVGRTTCLLCDHTIEEH